MTDYADAFQSEDAAAKYDAVVYADDSYDSILSRRVIERAREIIQRRLGTGVVQHDFACGTGRMLAGLADVVGEQHGYDPSAAMLARAGRQVPTARLHLIEPEGPPPNSVAAGGPAVVTCFRLFLNAPPAARSRAARFAAATLQAAGDGVLLLDNHGNRHSLRQLAQLRHHDEWFNSMSATEVRALLASAGLRVTEIHGFGVVPRSAYSLPRVGGVMRAVDERSAKLNALRRVAVHQLYVATLDR